MEIYTWMRQFADSWALLALFLVFVGVVFWVFRPGARKQQQDAAESIFRNEKRPAPPLPEKDTQ
ncbi:MAG: CcoQ/FixQ family Cbb3-type cytochrome c oxidase assembly chaperone [Paracoccus sp. (in: a-proteobacteria)]|nr:CcoQ/FixQ family Cbb3-type cytochrome c oxidase assembly chaperone [Paracoccus sp. (in: a-proteobacteria)]